jgi:hypothetical protein
MQLPDPHQQLGTAAAAVAVADPPALLSWLRLLLKPHHVMLLEIPLLLQSN